MKKLAILAAAMLSVSTLSAAWWSEAAQLGANGLNDISVGGIKASEIEVPAPVLRQNEPAKDSHVSGEITRLHLLAQTSKSQIFTYADTEAEFNEFTAMWRPILEKFGMKAVSTEYKNNYGIIKYESPDGRVVRDFMADKMDYNALDAAEMRKLQHELLVPLEQAGMTPIASFNIKNEVFRPTFNIYYLTRPEENMDRELQLRQLENGEDIDFDLLTGAVTLVKKDASFSMVYIGKLVGFKTKLAVDEAAATVKLADYRKFLAENQKEFIASRTHKLDPPIDFTDIKLNYLLNIYFFQ